MLGLVFRLIAISVLTAVAFAQPPSVAMQEAARARFLLHSSRFADKAWGAYLAGRLHTRELGDDIVGEFRTDGALANASPSSEEYGFVAALFDAAIEGGIEVPLKTLRPFEMKWSEPVLILLSVSKASDRQEVLLRLANTRYDLLWLAANNLLFGMRSTKWYAGMLGEIGITQRFTVVDSGVIPANDAGTGGGVCGDGSIKALDGFPPIAFYTLEEKPGIGGVLLAPGPANVYYRRTVVPTGEQRGFGSCFSVRRMNVRIGYLSELAKASSSKTESLIHHQTRIEYHGVKEFQREVDQSLQTQEQGVRELLRAIFDNTGLSGSGIILPVITQLNDLRKSATSLLPTVRNREIVLD